ncbi:MAG: AAA family ATPase [Lachnospiraceae bacterium]|nr:AAA family ATPase [Lachnospiraceae bacterium]
MARTVGIGIQNFSELIEENYFYIDKTSFIKEWWESGDSVTLITRPRRFGKTLNMSMAEAFFSVNYADRGDLFEGLSIWKEEKYRKLQGTYPVISLSFATIKESDYETANYRIRQLLMKQYAKYAFLQESDLLSDAEKSYCRMMASEMNHMDAPMALYQLSDFLCRYYGKKVIILLDEYDTPMQEAYVNGYWKELVAFTRSLFNATFKTNPYLARGIMTGITRVSKESIFSDLNHLKVVTTTSDEYATSFGFTEKEVFAALEVYGLEAENEKVKYWYDGFVFGGHRDIYNPWSILNFLDTGNYGTYWANTSSNSLVGKLIREGSRQIKTSFEELLKGGIISCPIDEQIVYDQLAGHEAAVWSLLLASGYVKVLRFERIEQIESNRPPRYELGLTNYEVERMFFGMVQSWFYHVEDDYNDFVKALLLGDLDAMNEYMNNVALESFSYFDTGRKQSGKLEPERFYHGFVLGLIVELEEKYRITSNRESGFGRYDIMLEPLEKDLDAIIIEFKVFNARKEKNLEETLQNALWQIEDKKYAAELISRGIPSECIRKYGFVFEGKNVLIG